MAARQNEGLYRPCVGIMMFNHQKNIFAGRRYGYDNDLLQMPQGGVKKNEVSVEAMKRELKEEISTNNVRVISESEKLYYYDFPYATSKKIYSGKYIGQEQRWFLVEFLGEDEEIDVNVKNPEFSSWRWVHAGDLMKNVIHFKRELYEEVIKEFKSILLAY